MARTYADDLAALVPPPPGPNGGSPSVITMDLLNKLREAFLIGANDEQACAYANIAPSTLYKYQKEYPGFIEYKTAWKQNPILTAKNTIAKALGSDVVTARWYLEKKQADEFGSKDEQTVTINQQFNTVINNDELVQRIAELLTRDEQGPDSSPTPAVESPTEGRTTLGSGSGGSEAGSA